MAKKKVDNTWGLWSLILGIASIVLFWAPILGIVSGILGIVFSNKQKKIADNGNAKVGKITGVIGLVLSILYLIAMICFILYLTIAAPIQTI